MIRLCSWLRSSVDSERVERLRMLLMKVTSLFFFAALCGSSDRLRVVRTVASDSGDFSELMSEFVVTVSPAKVTPEVIESAAATVIALIPKNLTELVIVVILKISRLLAFGCSETRTGSNTGM